MPDSATASLIASDGMNPVMTFRIKGLRVCLLAIAAACIIGACIEISLGDPLIQTVPYLLVALAFIFLWAIINSRNINSIERAAIILGILMVSGLASYQLSELAYGLYLVAILVIGFSESNLQRDSNSTFWRYFLISFLIISAAIATYFSELTFLPYAQRTLAQNIELILDTLIIVVLVFVVIHHYSRLNALIAATARDQTSLLQNKLDKISSNHRTLQDRRLELLQIQEKNAEQLNATRLQRARLRARQEELEQFAYAASHDLKEPVRTINSFTQVARRRMPTGLEERLGIGDYFQHVVQSAESMNRLLSSLLFYSRSSRTRLEIENVSLPAICREVVHSLPTTRQAQIHIDLLEIHVRSDHNALTSILEEVISNAIKFAKPDEAPYLRIHCQIDQGIVLMIDDNGIGIVEEYRERVFGLFQRLHPREQYTGAGVGLSLARRLAERCGHSIWLEQSPSGGTRACIRFEDHATALAENQDAEEQSNAMLARHGSLY